MHGENHKLALLSFLANGYIVIPNYFSSEIHDEVLSYFANNSGSLSKNMSTMFFNKKHCLAASSQLSSNSFVEFLSLLTGYSNSCIQQELVNNTFFQTVRLESTSRASDPQQNYHLDTFYPAFKFWYFPHDIDTASAPFQYVPSSHLPSFKMTKMNASRYCDNAYDSNYAISIDNTEGSLRATSADIDRLGSLKQITGLLFL